MILDICKYYCLRTFCLDFVTTFVSIFVNYFVGISTNYLALYQYTVTSFDRAITTVMKRLPRWIDVKPTEVTRILYYVILSEK